MKTEEIKNKIDWKEVTNELNNPSAYKEATSDQISEVRNLANLEITEFEEKEDGQVYNMIFVVIFYNNNRIAYLLENDEIDNLRSAEANRKGINSPDHIDEFKNYIKTL